jgi:prophage tail gpP-like protein
MAVHIIDAPTAPQQPSTSPVAVPITPPVLPQAPGPFAATAIQPPIIYPDGTPIPPVAATTFQQLQQDETATVYVNGRKFTYWESVYVEHRWADAYPVFRLTTSEEVPVAPLWALLQIKPEDAVQIWLGRQLAISGIVLSRQAAFDGNRHGVQIQGVGVTWLPTRASHLDPQGNFDGMPYMAIVAAVMAPWQGTVGFRQIGEVSGEPFKVAQIQPGENIWTFLERLGRQVNVTVGSDRYGNVVIIGGHAYDATAHIIEGVNLLRCQATISVENMFNLYVVRAQQPADDQTNGTGASEMEKWLNGKLEHYSPILTPAEQPLTESMLVTRTQAEQRWHEGTELQVLATLQGWYMPDGISLWQIGDDVMFTSPSAMLDQKLKIQTATFTQDNGQGTQTQLELVAPWLLRDVPGYLVDSPAAATAASIAAQNAKTQTPMPSTQTGTGPAVNQNPVFAPAPQQ